MTSPDVFCLGYRVVFDGFKEYHEHLEPIQESVEDEDD